jgi:hypothetical protein
MVYFTLQLSHRPVHRLKWLLSFSPTSNQQDDQPPDHRHPLLQGWII